MPRYFDYLLLGGGTSCGYAAAAIREIDKKGSVAILSADTEPPYDRPPFSKYYLMNPDMAVSDAHAKDDSFYPENHVELLLNTKAQAIELQGKVVRLASGEELGYGKLLYALGSEPRSPQFPGSDAVMLLRTASDSKAIKEQIPNAKSAVIIGGGYIGAEVAASLMKRGVEKVTVIEMGPRLLGRLGSDAAVDSAKRELESMGAVVHFNEEVAEIAPGRPHSVKTKSGKSFEGDVVIAGIGASPRISIARDAGLEIGKQGVRANSSLQTSDPSVFVAGDVAEYDDDILGRPFRAEHHLHAKGTGAHAGRAMAGDVKPYHKAPYFFSDIGELSMIFRGDPDASGTKRIFGDTKAPEFTEIIVRDDGRLGSLLDMRRDFKAQEPLNDAAEKIIEGGIRVSEDVANAEQLIALAK